MHRNITEYRNYLLFTSGVIFNINILNCLEKYKNALKFLNFFMKYKNTVNYTKKIASLLNLTP